MSGSLELYRTAVNVRGLGVGTLIEIDPDDPGWAGDIRMKRIVKVSREDPAARVPIAEHVEPAMDEGPILPLIVLASGEVLGRPDLRREATWTLL